MLTFYYVRLIKSKKDDQYEMFVDVWRSKEDCEKNIHDEKMQDLYLAKKENRILGQDDLYYEVRRVILK